MTPEQEAQVVQRIRFMKILSRFIQTEDVDLSDADFIKKVFSRYQAETSLSSE